MNAIVAIAVTASQLAARQAKQNLGRQVTVMRPRPRVITGRPTGSI